MTRDRRERETRTNAIEQHRHARDMTRRETREKKRRKWDASVLWLWWLMVTKTRIISLTFLSITWMRETERHKRKRKLIGKITEREGEGEETLSAVTRFTCSDVYVVWIDFTGTGDTSGEWGRIRRRRKKGRNVCRYISIWCALGRVSECVFSRINHMNDGCHERYSWPVAESQEVTIVEVTVLPRVVNEITFHSDM